jgi:hypothetical protein
VSHSYTKISQDYSLDQNYPLICQTCGLVKDIYYDEDIDADGYVFYYKGHNCSDDMNDWIGIDYEITCEEMIIKDIIE